MMYDAYGAALEQLNSSRGGASPADTPPKKQTWREYPEEPAAHTVQVRSPPKAQP